MEIRTCPNCGYKHSFKVYLKKMFFKFIDSKWSCINCQSVLSFNFKRRILLAAIALIPFGFTPIILEILNNLNIRTGFSWIIIFFIFTIWSILVYIFDTYSIIKDKHKC